MRIRLVMAVALLAGATVFVVFQYKRNFVPPPLPVSGTAELAANPQVQQALDRQWGTALAAASGTPIENTESFRAAIRSMIRIEAPAGSASDSNGARLRGALLDLYPALLTSVASDDYRVLGKTLFSHSVKAQIPPDRQFRLLKQQYVSYEWKKIDCSTSPTIRILTRTDAQQHSPASKIAWEAADRLGVGGQTAMLAVMEMPVVSRDGELCHMELYLAETTDHQLHFLSAVNSDRLTSQLLPPGQDHPLAN